MQLPKIFRTESKSDIMSKLALKMGYRNNLYVTKMLIVTLHVYKKHKYAYHVLQCMKTFFCIF